jgi:Alpha/beta hydrolase
MSTSTRSAFRVSCRPEQLDRFAWRDNELNQLIGLFVRQLSDSFAIAERNCEEPSIAHLSPPIGEIEGLAREQRSFLNNVRQTANGFRRADMGSLVDSWNRQALASLATAQAKNASLPQQRDGWKLLRYETGDRGRIMEVKGDLATATHIVFFVPGMTNEIGNVDQGVRPRSDALYNELVAAAGPGETVAVVMWLGYRSDRLTELYDASSNGHAQAGGITLRQDVAAVAGTGTKATITVVAHSYGTAVVGQAMTGGLDADRVVVLGSPGMDAQNRAALGSAHVQLYASRTGSDVSAVDKAKGVAAGVAVVVTPVAALGATAALLNKIPVVKRVSPLRPVTEPNLVSAAYKLGTGSDPVSAAPVLGPDPTNKGFGANVFPSSGTGHSAYFDPGSTGMQNIASIALGREPVTTPTRVKSGKSW